MAQKGIGEGVSPLSQSMESYKFRTQRERRTRMILQTVCSNTSKRVVLSLPRFGLSSTGVCIILLSSPPRHASSVSTCYVPPVHTYIYRHLFEKKFFFSLSRDLLDSHSAQILQSPIHALPHQQPGRLRRQLEQTQPAQLTDKIRFGLDLHRLFLAICHYLSLTHQDGVLH